LCASNQNDVLTELLRQGRYQTNRPFYTTLSPSMDILVSSNLERMLYYASSGDTELVARQMESLAKTGAYDLPQSVFQSLSNLFVGGRADDGETKAEIRRLWTENGYLADPHTAVASAVVRRYRAETGDLTKALLVSTASPFKFSASVLSALTDADGPDGPDAVAALAEHSGIPAPAALVNLDKRPVRFRGCCGKNEIEETARTMLGVSP